MRYRNRDPMERRQAQELINQILQIFEETINNFARKCGYRQDSVLYRELRQDVCHGLVKRFRIKDLQISFKDTGVTEELNQFDTRNQSVKKQEEQEEQEERRKEKDEK